MTDPSVKATEEPATPDNTAVALGRSLKVHVVAHTHWDREWYHAAARFRARLVALVDALLAAPIDASTPFLLDGQTIVLSDYLAVRPERQADIRSALAAGAIEAGPWYVLADNLIPSGEAIVRNLEAGRRWLARAGVAAPRVAYCPDSFGHPAAMPQIAAGFGCETAVVWRGFGGPSFPPCDSVWWESADGSRILAYHLSPDGYELGSALPTTHEAATLRWHQLATMLSARNSTGVVLLPVGADHHAAPPQLSDAVALLRAVATRSGSEVMRGSLALAMSAVVRAAHDAEGSNRPLPVVRGELRDSYGYTWTLPGTYATRAAQKRINAQLERALVYDVEPWSVLAWLHGAPADRGVSTNGALTLAQLPVLITQSWEALLRTHPHDTLCGCAIDAVARDMTAGQQSVAAMTEELREAALRVALQHDPVVARAGAICDQPLTVVRNRLARPRAGLAELTLVDTIAHVSVGPGSAPAAEAAETRGDALLAVASLGDCFLQPLSQRVFHARRESPQHYPDNDLVRARRVLAWVPEVPASGIHVFDARTPATDPPQPVTARRDGERFEMSNGLLRIVASRDGLTIISGDRVLTDALSIETISDAGDSYTPSLRGNAESLSLTAIRPGLRGPLRGSVHLVWRWRSGRERIRVCTTIVLDADATVVRCHVRGNNARRDHRLQLVWNTDVRCQQVVADAAFGAVTRAPFATVDATTAIERPPTTMPMHRWMSQADKRRGASLLSDGLAEAEGTDLRLAVTLVRAIGQLSRNDLPERPGHAGWPVSIPDAQCQGAFAARVALLLHGPLSKGTCVKIDDAADAFLLPLRGESWRDLETPTRALHGPRLDGDGLRVSAMHITDDGGAIRLRAMNRRDTKARGQWVLPVGAWEYRRCRLDGTALDSWSQTRETISFEIDACALVTFEVRRAELPRSV